jgi:hypothetical protein
VTFTYMHIMFFDQIHSMLLFLNHFLSSYFLLIMSNIYMCVWVYVLYECMCLLINKLSQSKHICKHKLDQSPKDCRYSGDLLPTALQSLPCCLG